MAADSLHIHILVQILEENGSTMKYLIILVAASLVSADRLENVYLPPNARGANAGGANAGLQTPLGPGQQQQNFGGSRGSGNSGHSGSHSSNSASSNAEILKYDNEITEDGYRYAYETSDGTKAEQQGHVLPGATPEERSLQVSGSYSYIGDDGQIYSITYTADENGYHAVGAHLPTPPPIPEAILKSLQLTDTSRSNQYDSQKSSYDADAGYAK